MTLINKYIKGNNRNHANYYAYGLPVQGSEVKDPDPYLYGSKEFYSLRGVNLYDFNARTYALDIARFMQPDPLATENHGVSPYIYCNSDPINFIDPTGEKVYFVNGTGRIISEEEAGSYNSLNMKEINAQYEGLDVVIIIDKDGKIIRQSETFDEGTIVSNETGFNNKTISMFTVNNYDIGKYLFEFLADNTTVEWGHTRADNLLTKQRDINYIGTSGEETSCSAILFFTDNLMSPAVFNVNTIAHSHPLNDYPSGLEPNAKRGDIPAAKYFQSRYKMPTQHMIYHKPTKSYIPYYYKSTYLDFGLTANGIGLAPVIITPK